MKKAFLCSVFPLLVLSGCKPTFPKAKVSELIIKLCKEEYNIDVTVATVGKTIAVCMQVDNLLTTAREPTEGAFEKLGNVLQVLSRVALSTDADLEFVTVIARDSQIPNFELVLIRYVEDIKRFMVGDISRGEYLKRMVMETRFSSPDPFSMATMSPEDHPWWAGEVLLSDFLAKQISRRIEEKFTEDKNLRKNFTVVRVEGEYVPGAGDIRKGSFRFLLNILKKNPKSETVLQRRESAPDSLFSVVWEGVSNALRNLKEKRAKKYTNSDILPISLETAETILRRYNFHTFDRIELLDVNTGKSIVINNKIVQP